MFKAVAFVLTPWRCHCRVPTERMLNLGASMGDLLFKLHDDSQVIRSDPDVSFVKLPKEGKCMLLAASDGLWNYLPENLAKDKQMNDFVMNRYVIVALHIAL